MVFHSAPVLKDSRSIDDIFGIPRLDNNSHLAKLDAEEAAYKARIESIRLTGYRFLKPPGVQKTLKVMHEEESYFRDMSYMSSHHGSVNFDSRTGNSGNSAADLRFMPTLDMDLQAGPQLEEEEVIEEEEDEEEYNSSMIVDENYRSVDDINASFPSMYHRTT